MEPVSRDAAVVEPGKIQGHNKAPPGNRSMQVPALFRAVGTARVGGALYVACTCNLRSSTGLREYMYCADSESSRVVGFSSVPGGPGIGSPRSRWALLS